MLYRRCKLPTGMANIQVSTDWKSLNRSKPKLAQKLTKVTYNMWPNSSQSLHNLLLPNIVKLHLFLVFWLTAFLLLHRGYSRQNELAAFHVLKLEQCGLMQGCTFWRPWRHQIVYRVSTSKIPQNSIREMENQLQGREWPARLQHGWCDRQPAGPHTASENGTENGWRMDWTG